MHSTTKTTGTIATDAFETITTDSELREYCDRTSGATTIGFDTEFVSEHTYRPHLCLVQVAADDRLAIIDTMTVEDMTPFWEMLATGDHQTIVHAGREEIGFSLSAIGRVPANLMDLQFAAGFAGLDYPAGYGTLVQKLLGLTAPKGETRTDWRRRPLSKGQIQYALSDVIHLAPMRDVLQKRLADRGRTKWLEGELLDWVDEVTVAHRRDRWRRASGITNLSPRGKAIIRELWRWREQQAERRNMPVKRVLRDDLMVELAKRQLDDVDRIREVRGMDRGDLRRAYPELAACVTRALALSQDELPQAKTHRKRLPPQLSVLGQFLSSALSSLCRREQLASSIVGNPSDVRDLVAYRLGFGDQDSPPSLARGWRAEVVGSLLDDLLAGRMTLRIADPMSDEPLVVEPT